MARHRVTPEERRSGGGSPGPLFEQTPVETARATGHAAASAAASRASTLDHGWRESALEAVKNYSRTHERFLAEHVGIAVPPGADPRAIGHVLREAQRLGYVQADGCAPASSSNGSMKTCWRSLLFSEELK